MPKAQPAMPEPRAKIGFVGLGRMGQPMAAHVAEAGVLHQVLDARTETADRFAAEHGVPVAASLKAMGEACNAIILMLPDGGIVRDVVLGASPGGDALLAGDAGSLSIIDMSSSAPLGTRALGEALAQRGVGLLDAPVSGGVKKARSGELAIMVGGDGAELERWRWLLELMGTRILATGPLGSGHAVKALNNYVSAAGLAAAAEALHVAETFGVQGDVLIDVLNASTGRNNSTENKFKQFILSATYNSGFALDLMSKDLDTAAELARQSDVDVPMMRCCSSLWKEACGVLPQSADHTEYARYQKTRNAAQTKPSKQ